MTGNREYKSDVFSMLMSSRDNALEIYNAVNGSDYKDSNMVEICTLDKGISLSVRNDASFILDANLSVYEHQSTICPNMPVRSLIYFSVTLNDIIRKRNVYGRTLIKIPVPRFVVFYNGTKEQPEQYELKLSDAFAHRTDDPQLELKCRVYNINYGRNPELMDHCSVLKEYSIFVDYVRFYYAQNNYNDLGTSTNQAIDRCIKENILKEFLIENRAEVVKVTQLGYTFERQLELEREEAISEGMAQGMAQGIAQGMAQGMAQGITQGRTIAELQMISRKLKKNKSVEQIAEELEIDTNYVNELCDRLKPFAPDYDIDKIKKEVCQKPE